MDEDRLESVPLFLSTARETASLLDREQRDDERRRIIILARQASVADFTAGYAHPDHGETRHFKFRDGSRLIFQDKHLRDRHEIAKLVVLFRWYGR